MGDVLRISQTCCTLYDISSSEKKKTLKSKPLVRRSRFRKKIQIALVALSASCSKKTLSLTTFIRKGKQLGLIRERPGKILPNYRLFSPIEAKSGKNHRIYKAHTIVRKINSQIVYSFLTCVEDSRSELCENWSPHDWYSRSPT